MFLLCLLEQTDLHLFCMFMRHNNSSPAGAAIIGGTGGTYPPTFWLGNAKVNVPPLVIRHFSDSVQNAYLSEELKGFCIIKI